MKTKYILLVDENSNSIKYARERNMPAVDTFTSFIDLYEPARDIVSLETGVWDKLEIHNLTKNAQK